MSALPAGADSTRPSICLDILDLNPRVHVEGGAGTGKTMLACEITRRMAADGASVLLLCFNTPLAHCLYSFAEAHRSEAGSIWAGSFHQLCRDWSGRAGLPWKEPADSRTAEAAEFWNDESGLLLLDAAKEITDRFDALVIDEAQDFMRDWFEILISLLRDPPAGASMSWSCATRTRTSGAVTASPPGPCPASLCGPTVATPAR
jgi:hypothetical protein